MKKTHELADPNSCLNKAAADEPLFVLRAKDPAAPATIRNWIEQRLALRLNKRSDAKMQEAYDASVRMEEWRTGVTTPGVIIGHSAVATPPKLGDGAHPESTLTVTTAEHMAQVDQVLNNLRNSIVKCLEDGHVVVLKQKNHFEEVWDGWLMTDMRYGGSTFVIEVPAQGKT